MSDWYTLTELRQRPELLRAPEARIPRLAWEARLTLVAAAPKFGKSTLVRHGMADMLMGRPFLGEPTRARPGGWLCLDEPLSDLVRGMDALDTQGGLLLIREDRPASVAELNTTIVREGLEVLVIDTLTEFASGIVEDGNQASQVQPLMAALRSIARETGCAIILIHHLGKAGTVLGSVQWTASADVILTMTAADDVPTRRICHTRGRGVFMDFTLDWDSEAGYSLASGELSLDLRLYKAVEAYPGIGTRKLRESVAGRNADKDAALRGLEHRGEVVNLGDRNGAKWYTAKAAEAEKPGHTSGHTRGTLRVIG